MEACPFCSGKAFPEPPSLGRSHWNVVCDDCGASGPHGHDEAQSVRRWNDLAMKAKEPPLETVERVVAAMWQADVSPEILAAIGSEMATLARAAIASMGDDGLREALEPQDLVRQWQEENHEWFKRDIAEIVEGFAKWMLARVAEGGRQCQ